MVKIPALELEGQNWKFYRAKYLEAAATYYCLDVLGGRPDNGTDDWEEGNALLCSLFMETIPASIYYRIRLKSAHQIYNHLAKHFRDNDPIQELCAKKFAARTNEAKRDPSAENPTSEYAAIGAERENPPTKDLTRGIEDVNDRNVGRTKDPRTSLEASAEGTSAERAEGPMAPCAATLHETQDQPQNSLQATLRRLPIEDEPSECEQEAAESLVTAERTIGMVQSAKPRETVADVDRMALLGGDLAERACGVDEGGRKVADVDGKAALGGELAERVQGVSEGDEMVRKDLRLQKTRQYCEERRQHNENANDVPNPYGLPLEGEWEVCSSGRLSCERSTSEGASVDELNATAKCCQQLCMAHGDPGYEAEPTGTLNESDALVIASIMSEEPGGGGIPRVHLRGANWRAGSTNGLGRGTDVSGSQTVGLTGQTDASNASNEAETNGISCGEGAGTYLGAGGANRVVNAMNGVRRHADALSGPTDVPSVETHAIIPTNAPETVSIPRKRAKPPDSPSGPAKWTPDVPDGCRSHADAPRVCTDVQSVAHETVTAENEARNVSIPRNCLKPLNSPMETTRRRPDEPNGCGSRADGPSVHTDTHSVGNATETAKNEAESVRSRRIGSRTQNSPNAREIATPKLPKQWTRVSIGGGDVYVPFNAPIAIPTRRIVFGRPESGDEAIAPSVKGERAGEGDGGGYGGDGDVGDTTSGGDIDSKRVEAALLAGESQLERQS